MLILFQDPHVTEGVVVYATVGPPLPCWKVSVTVNMLEAVLLLVG
jgi:hypothetical protein